MRLLGGGAAAGLEALTQGIYWHDAVALRQAEVCRIPLGVFRELQAHNVQLADRVLEQWEQQLRDSDRWLAELHVGSVAERVQRLRALLAELEGGKRHRIELPLMADLPMADLALILGTTRESASRALADLKRARALTRVAPHTYECDPAVLA